MPLCSLLFRAEVPIIHAACVSLVCWSLPILFQTPSGGVLMLHESPLETTVLKSAVVSSVPPPKKKALLTAERACMRAL